MTSFRRRLLLKFMEFFDLGVIAASFGLATLVVHTPADPISLIDFLAMRIRIQNFIFVALFFLGGHVSYSTFGLYKSRRLSSRSSEILDILKATALGGVVLWISASIFRLELIKPIFIAVFFTTTTSALTLSRLAVRRLLGWVRCRGHNLRYLLIVGTNARAIRFARQIEARPELGYRILGFADDEWIGVGEFRQNGYPLVANLSGFAAYLRSHTVDEVVIELPVKSHYQRASEILAICEEQGILVRYLPDFFSTKHARPKTEDIEDSSFVTTYSSLTDDWPLFVKRVLDILFSIAALGLLIPVFLVIAILIKLTSVGPAFFVQERVGLNKRRFRLYKFRTMIPAAEALRAELECQNEMDGPVFKIKEDPRITPIGRILRRTSIDELPQLFNVLKGDMSLVGPRPLPIHDYSGFDQDWHRRRFSIRPGITCLWQISGRNQLNFSQWMDLDIKYIDNWSLNLDFQIILHTIPAVLRGTGAR